MSKIIKIGLEEGGGVPVDTVEKLLTLVTQGEDLAVFASDGSIVFVADNAGDFEEIQ